MNSPLRRRELPLPLGFWQKWRWRLIVLAVLFASMVVSVSYVVYCPHKEFRFCQFQFSCWMDNSEDCFELANMHAIGAFPVLVPEKKQALFFYKKACHLRYGASCLKAGEMLEQEKGVALDMEQAFFYYQRACHLGIKEGCMGLGQLYSQSSKKEKQKDAIAFYQKACRLKDSRGCLFLGSLYSEKKDCLQANVYYQKACQLNSFLCWKRCKSVPSLQTPTHSKKEVRENPSVTKQQEKKKQKETQGWQKAAQ